MADQTDLEFEREKWRADMALRERELTLKERDSARARWSNPLALAVFAAAVAAAGNAAVTWLNGQEERTVETLRSVQSQSLEERKSEAARILEIIKTGDPDKAANNLQFLIDTGLITDPVRLKAMNSFLANRKPGQGPNVSDGCKLYPTLC
jgi:hypothetical protein